MPDAQASHEKTITSLLPALAGANVIYGLGMLELGITFDFAQLVIDNEIAEAVKYAVKGIPVSEANLAIDVIRDVGIGGEFVSHMHTFENFKQHQFDSRLFNRQMRETWEAAGGKDLLERAREKAKYILENHQPDPLPQGTDALFEEAIADAEENIK